MLHSGSAAGWQVAVLALNNRWLAEGQCPVMFILEFVRAALFVLLVKETVMQLYGVHREAQSRQSSSLLALVGCAVIDSGDLSEWQIGRIDYVNQRGAPSTADLAHMAGRIKSGAVAAQVLISVVIQTVCSGWCSFLTALRAGDLYLWRRILDSLPWEWSKLFCAQTSLSALGYLIFVCVCVREVPCFLSLFPSPLTPFSLFLFLSLSLSIYLSLCGTRSFPLCGMCSFVQLELDCLIPGGERLMVLLSSQSEMDSTTRARVWVECIACVTYCRNLGSILRK